MSDFAQFMQQVIQARSGGPRITEVADSDSDAEGQEPSNTSFVPQQIVGKMVEMTARTFSKAAMPTVIVGLITEGYNDASYKHDKGLITKLLGMEVNDPMIYDMKLYPEANNKNRMDMEACVAKIIAMGESDAFKNGPFEKIRIIRMGNAGHNFLFQAMMQVLENYATPKSTLQLVTLADTSDCDWLDFSKSIIGTRLIGHVQYVNTMDYTPFGEFKAKKQCNMF